MVQSAMGRPESCRSGNVDEGYGLVALLPSLWEGVRCYALRFHARIRNPTSSGKDNAIKASPAHAPPRRRAAAAAAATTVVLCASPAADSWVFCPLSGRSCCECFCG
ncbi:hypothetical protein LZ32DRAFT_608008 [Colletotrichum eremochloae]|nr:hypothetical protein LZ32DRAFT_608008 [Colletotrichum eremochloae]